VEADLRKPNSKVSLILYYGSRLNLTRTQERAFHPRGKQQVLELGPEVFAVLRISPEGDQHVLAITNVTAREVRLEISLPELGVEEKEWQDLIGEKHWKTEGARLQLMLQPYDVAWLKPRRQVEGTGWLH
jgi:sucrose phosphorylase